MAVNSRAKGKQGELELAKLFREHGFADARRSVQYRGTADSMDVLGLPGCHVECKRTETARLYEWMDRAVSEAGADATPVVFHRRSRRPWLAILPASAFLQLLHLAEYGHAPWEIIEARPGQPDVAEAS